MVDMTRRTRHSGPHQDSDGRTYAIEGDFGAHEARGTAARVVIKCFSRTGGWLPSRSIRFDIHTAKEFHTALGKAIERAETEHAMFVAELQRLKVPSILGIVLRDDVVQ